MKREVGGIEKERITVFEVNACKMIEKGMLNHIASIEKSCEKSNSEEGEKGEGGEEKRVTREEVGTTVLITIEEEGKCVDDRKESEMNSKSIEEGSQSDFPFG